MSKPAASFDKHVLSVAEGFRPNGWFVEGLGVCPEFIEGANGIDIDGIDKSPFMLSFVEA